MLFPMSYIPLVIAPHIGQLFDSETLSFSILALLSTISILAFYLILLRIFKNRHDFLKDYEDDFLGNTNNFKLQPI